MIALIFGILAVAVTVAILVNYNKKKQARPEVIKAVYEASVPSQAPTEEPVLEPVKAVEKPKLVKKAATKKTAPKAKKTTK